MNQASERTECAKAAMAGTASPQTSHRDEAAIAEASATNTRSSAIYVAAFAVSIFFCYLLMRAASVWVFFGTSVSDCFYRAEDRNRWLLVVSCALLAGLLLFLITRVRSARGRWMLGLATISVLVLVVFQNAAPKGTESMLQNLRARISPKTTWNELKATIPRQAYRRHSRPSRIEDFDAFMVGRVHSSIFFDHESTAVSFVDFHFRRTAPNDDISSSGPRMQKASYEEWVEVYFDARDRVCGFSSISVLPDLWSRHGSLHPWTPDCPYVDGRDRFRPHVTESMLKERLEKIVPAEAQASELLSQMQTCLRHLKNESERSGCSFDPNFGNTGIWDFGRMERDYPLFNRFLSSFTFQNSHFTVLPVVSYPEDAKGGWVEIRVGTEKVGGEFLFSPDQLDPARPEGTEELCSGFFFRIIPAET